MLHRLCSSFRKNLRQQSKTQKDTKGYRPLFEALEPRLVLSAIPIGTEFADDGLPLLDSYPEAPVSIFLDFQYESRIEDVLEKDQKHLFNPSGDPEIIDAVEQEMIASQWARVSAAYAPFDVNITTVMPDLETPFIWAAIYREFDGPGGGGGARSFGYMKFDEYFDERYDAVSGRVEDGLLAQSWIREGAIYSDVITHETGHSHWVNGHESTDTEGDKVGIHTLPIVAGPFTRSTGSHGSWYNFTTEWTYKENPNGLFYVRDNLDVLSNTITDGIVNHGVDPSYTGDGRRPDDHVGTLAGATVMTWDMASSSFIENGVIERKADTDTLSFDWSGGTAWVGASTALPNSLLDVRIVVKNAGGNVVGAADPTDSEQAALRLNNLAAGTYYVEVASDGDYSELGFYEVTVSASLPQSLKALAEISMNGNSLADSSGQGNDGSWSGSAQWTTGRDGTSAARLNGSNKIEVNSASGNFTPKNVDLIGRTIAFWFKADSTSGSSEKVLFEDPINSRGYKIYLQNGKLKVFVKNDEGLSNWRGGAMLETSVTLSSGQWYHVALTHRGTFSVNLDTIKLFLDGEEVARADGAVVPKTDRFYIGSTSFAGAIDDVHIHSEAVPQHLIAEWADNSELSQLAPTGTPFNVTATTTHDTTSLSWNTVTGATGYRILRSLDNQNFALAGTVDAATTSFDDTGLRGSQSYFYRIDAQGANGVGAAEVLTRAQPIRYVQYSKVRNDDPDDYWASKMDVWGHGVDGLYAMGLTFFGPDGHRDTGLRIDHSTDGVNFTTLVTLPPNESIYYDNGPGNNGLVHGETYTYRLVPIDDLGPVMSAAVILETEPLNFIPEAVEDTYVVNATGTKVLAVLGNDTDWDQETLFIDSFTQGNKGEVIDNGNGTLTYTQTDPAAVADSFTYTVTDAFGATDSATVYVTFTHEGDIGIFTDSRDIGGPTLPGAASYSEGIYSMVASGSDIWGSSDEFHFLHRQETGDIELTARVDSFESPNDWGKAGLMFRDGTSGSAKHVMLLVRPDDRVTLEWRETSGDSSGYNGLKGDTDVPKYIRLVRSGNTFTGYYSTNGTSWTNAGSKTISMSATLEVGLAMTSHEDDALAPVQFSHVQFKPNSEPDTSPDTVGTTVNIPMLIDVGTDLLGNDTDPEGNEITLDSITQTSFGLLVNNGDQTLSYTPGTDFTGYDSFTYTVRDSNGGMATETVTIIVGTIYDLDHSGTVDGGDVAILTSNYGLTSGVTTQQGEFNGDGQINGQDLNILLSRFGESLPESASAAEVPLVASEVIAPVASAFSSPEELLPMAFVVDTDATAREQEKTTPVRRQKYRPSRPQWIERIQARKAQMARRAEEIARRVDTALAEDDFCHIDIHRQASSTDDDGSSFLKKKLGQRWHQAVDRLFGDR